MLRKTEWQALPWTWSKISQSLIEETKLRSYNADRGREEIKEYLGIKGFVSAYVILINGVEWVVYGPSAEGNGPKIEPG
jgi:hypothetical protein